MKIINVLIFMGMCTLVNAQSIKSFVISSCGTFTTQVNKGGSTLDQPATMTVGSGGYTLVEGFHFLQEANDYPECLTVTIADNDGFGSLRNAIACAEEDDIVDFAATMAGEVIAIEQPAIEIDKEIMIENVHNPIYLINFDSDNTEPLIEILQSITIQGIQLLDDDGGMIIRIAPLANVTWK